MVLVCVVSFFVITTILRGIFFIIIISHMDHFNRLRTFRQFLSHPIYSPTVPISRMPIWSAQVPWLFPQRPQCKIWSSLWQKAPLWISEYPFSFIFLPPLQCCDHTPHLGAPDRTLSFSLYCHDNVEVHCRDPGLSRAGSCYRHVIDTYLWK